MKKLIACLLLLTVSCSKEDPFTVIGDWRAESFYCNNRNSCIIVDEAIFGTYSFSIVSIDSEGDLITDNYFRHKPECKPPYCHVSNWPIESAAYVNGILTINWMNDHVFTGVLDEEEFKGEIVYYYGGTINHPQLESYVWNDKIVFTKY